MRAVTYWDPDGRSADAIERRIAWAGRRGGADAAGRTAAAAARGLGYDPRTSTCPLTVHGQANAQRRTIETRGWLYALTGAAVTLAPIARAATTARATTTLTTTTTDDLTRVTATEAGRTVTIGRNMSERVIPYADNHGYDFYRGTPSWVPRTTIERISPRTLERIDLSFNRRWIRGEVRRGSRVVDIGEPPGYRPSPFYDMEHNEVADYWNYVEDLQP